jgi:hypothetical protein
MSHIVAGRFDHLNQAQAALEALNQEGFKRTEYDSFYVGPPGQNAMLPIGGDVHSDAASTKGGVGAAAGAILGVAAGIAVGGALVALFDLHAATMLGCAAVGAYLGSFGGALGRLGPRRRDQPVPTREHPAEPAGGEVVAVCVEDEHGQMTDREKRALSVLEQHGARDLGVTEGEWRDGAWRDFDPRAPLTAPQRAGRTAHQPPDRGYPA